MVNKMIKYISKNIQDTKNIAAKLLKYLENNNVIVFSGPLGVGKTLLINEICKSLGADDIHSPTFTIVNEYLGKNNKKIFHFDVYRLKDSNDFLNSIGDEYFTDGICLIEWGEKIKDILPKNTIYVNMNYANINNPYDRTIEISGGNIN